MRLGFLCMLWLLTLSACAQKPSEKQITPTSSATPTTFSSPTSRPSDTPRQTRTPNPTATRTATPLPSSTPTRTATPTPVPTYEILRGEVNVAHVSCFYGPSKAYLYKYGLLGGNVLEIIGRMEDTGYIQVRAIAGDNPCWMNLEWMDVRGDIGLVKPVDPLDLVLPASPYYNALDSAIATRDGNEVTISWTPLYLRAGDDSEQEPYLVEAWLCQNGEVKFTPIGSYQLSVTVIDEAGCLAESHARVYGVEKHGYTKYREVLWPTHEP